MLNIRFGMMVAALLTMAAAPVKYSISPVESGGKITALAIEVDFAAPRSGVTTINLPNSFAGVDQLWRNVVDFSVSGATKIVSPNPQTRVIYSVAGKALEIRYRLISPNATSEESYHGQPVVPQIDGHWFYALGEGVFAVPQELSASLATLEWKAPADDAFVSDLEDVAAQGTLTPDLMRNGVLLGGEGIRIIRAGWLRLAVHGEPELADKDLAQLVQSIVLAERGFWHDPPDRPFLVALSQDDPKVMMTSGIARQQGFALTLAPQTPMSFTRFLIAHENFHTWNPWQLGGFASDPRQEAYDRWFTEGFTDFYARRLLLRSRLETLSEFAAEWNMTLIGYDGSRVRNTPAREASAIEFTDTDAGSLPYQRGAMLAALWDAELRSRSEPSSDSLDQLLLEQRARARKDASVSGAALFVKVAASHGLNVEPDLKRYLDRGETIILPRDVFGPCIHVESAAQPDFDRGFDVVATQKANMHVSGLVTDSPALAAGLRNGMQLLRRVAGQPGDSTVPYVWQVRDTEGHVKVISYLPAGKKSIMVQRLKTDTIQGVCLDANAKR